MNVRNRCLPYEVEPGATESLYRKWMELAKEELADGSYNKFSRNIRNIIKDFEALPIHEDMWKPKVGIVGEILVKYHPLANNNLEQVLIEEGAEVVMPDFMDFFM